MAISLADVSRMKVSDLRDALEARGLSKEGLKPHLVERLREWVLQQQQQQQQPTEGAGNEAHKEGGQQKLEQKPEQEQEQKPEQEQEQKPEEKQEQKQEQKPEEKQEQEQEQEPEEKQEQKQEQEPEEEQEQKQEVERQEDKDPNEKTLVEETVAEEEMKNGDGHENGVEAVISEDQGVEKDEKAHSQKDSEMDKSGGATEAPVDEHVEKEKDLPAGDVENGDGGNSKDGEDVDMDTREDEKKAEPGDDDDEDDDDRGRRPRSVSRSRSRGRRSRSRSASRSKSKRSPSRSMSRSRRRRRGRSVSRSPRRRDGPMPDLRLGHRIQKSLEELYYDRLLEPRDFTSEVMDELNVLPKNLRGQAVQRFLGVRLGNIRQKDRFFLGIIRRFQKEMHTNRRERHGRDSGRDSGRDFRRGYRRSRSRSRSRSYGRRYR